MSNSDSHDQPAQLHKPRVGSELVIQQLASLGAVADLSHLLHDRAADQNDSLARFPSYERTVDELRRVLGRRRRAHILFVGEDGIGQSAFLANFVRHHCSPDQFDHFLMLDCRYIAPDNCNAALHHLFDCLDRLHRTALYISGFASLIKHNPSNQLPHLMARLVGQQNVLIGQVTPHEFEEYFIASSTASDAVIPVTLDEPDIRAAIHLLNGYARGLQLEYDLEITPAAVESAVRISHHFILNQRLPSKALRILSEICEEQRYAKEHGAPARRIDEPDVIQRVSVSSGIPIATLRGVPESNDFERSLSAWVVGQEHAIKQVSDELLLIKAGLTDPNKPASVMLFVGQTGTGKTEMAKALAQIYSTSRRLKVFTLGNFSEPHSVSGIIGVPPGYVGHDKGGRLINDLNADPFGVFLLDEADKSHPDVLQPFLNLFDEGWVEDQRGSKAYADRAIFVLTTNVGQRQIGEMCRRGCTVEEIESKVRDMLPQIRHGKSNRPVFAPELLARIKQIVVFRSLDCEAMMAICQLMADQRVKVWKIKRHKDLHITRNVVNALGKEAYRRDQASNGKEGGRMVRKLLSHFVDVSIERAIVNQLDVFRHCSEVLVDLNEGDGVECITVSFALEHG